MGFFFGHARGSVKMVEGPWQSAPQFRVRLQGLRRNITRQRAIITQVGMTQNGNFQFLHTINDQIFVYVFGDRISELLVSGVAFGNPCDNRSATGLDDILRGYEENKLSVTGRPVIAAIGGFRWQSFLTGMQMEVADATLLLGQFSYRFHSFPSG